MNPQDLTKQNEADELSEDELETVAGGSYSFQFGNNSASDHYQDDPEPEPGEDEPSGEEQ